jgi:hypothetical protein
MALGSTGLDKPVDQDDRPQPAEWPPPPQPLRSGKVTSEAAARLPRQSLDQTRADLLEAAVRIVNEYVSAGPRDGDPPVDLLPFLRLDEVLDGASELARRRLEEEGRLRPDERVAPLTPGAFYKAFAIEHQDGGHGAAISRFRHAVTRHMVDDHSLLSAEKYITLGKQMAEAGQPWSEMVRLGVTMEFVRWSRTPALILMSALALHGKANDVAEWTAEVDAWQMSQVLRIYQELLPVFGRRMRPGLQLQDMATTVFDLIGGMALNARFNAEPRDKTITMDVDGSGPKEWHLCAFAAWGIYNLFTEADDS